MEYVHCSNHTLQKGWFAWVFLQMELALLFYYKEHHFVLPKFSGIRKRNLYIPVLA